MHLQLFDHRIPQSGITAISRSPECSSTQIGKSRQNALVKDLRKAFSQAELTQQGFMAVEGVRMIEEAIRSGLRFQALFLSEGVTHYRSGALYLSGPLPKGRAVWVTLVLGVSRLRLFTSGQLAPG